MNDIDDCEYGVWDVSELGVNEAFAEPTCTLLGAIIVGRSIQ